jgi:hypothetical protein
MALEIEEIFYITVKQRWQIADSAWGCRENSRWTNREMEHEKHLSVQMKPLCLTLKVFGVELVC